MNRILLQGRALTLREKTAAALKQARSISESPLRAQVDETLRSQIERKEQGLKTEPLNKVIKREKGTPSIAEWMGY